VTPSEHSSFFMQQPLSLILNPLNGTKKSSRFFLLGFLKGKWACIQTYIRCHGHNHSTTRIIEPINQKVLAPGILPKRTAGTELAVGRVFYLDL